MAIDFLSPDPRGRELRLLILRAQHERYLAGEVTALVERAFNQVLDVLLSAKFRDLTAAQRARTAELFRELDRIISTGYTGIADYHVKAMQGYSQLESDIARATANAVLSTGAGDLAVSFYRLPKAYLSAIARLPIQGLNVGDWFDGQAAKMSLNTKRIIQQGLIEGKGPAEISRLILAPDKLMGPKLPPALSRQAKREATAITRTTINAVQNDAQMKSFEQLPASVSDSYRLVVVRDARLSKICAALADRVFRYDDPNRMVPPFHISCRTTVMALLLGAELSPADQKALPLTFRSFGDWLTGQPASMQNEILGATRAQWFRDGKMSLSEIIDSDNRVLTLSQLRSTLGLDAVVHQ
jgi:SPP1 gp7 family putative phage head morphogenesis protein